MIQNTLHCLRQCLITPSAVILSTQLLNLKPHKQTLWTDRGGRLGFSADFATPDGQWYQSFTETGVSTAGRVGRVNGLKRFINQQVNHQIVASAQQPSHQPNAMKFFCSRLFFSDKCPGGREQSEQN